MKIKRDVDWESDDREWTISEVLRRECTPFDRSGIAECAEDKADETMTRLGRLLETLADKGILNGSEICEILGYGWAAIKP